MIQTVAHPTDFSEASMGAFAHALRIALDTRSKLYIMHVKSTSSDDSWQSFPHVRQILSQWGLMAAGDPPSQIEAKLGMKAVKVEIAHRDPALGLFEFIVSHRPDLIVLASHGREGLNRWLHGTVSEDVTRHTHVPTLFLGPKAKSFVDPATGLMRLETILMPVASSPTPSRALEIATQILGPLRVSETAYKLLHIGDKPPTVLETTRVNVQLPVETMKGDVVETITDVADDRHVDLIVMPTAGHQGFLDALRGSTTERVLREASCPLLAIPAP